MSDLILGLFLAPEIESKQDKKPKTFPGIGMENPITFSCLDVSYGLLKVNVPRFSGYHRLIYLYSQSCPWAVCEKASIHLGEVWVIMQLEASLNSVSIILQLNLNKNAVLQNKRFWGQFESEAAFSNLYDADLTLVIL